MRVLVVADPLERLSPSTDSSVAVMEAAVDAGHDVWHCTGADLSLTDGGVVADARAVARRGRQGVAPGPDRTLDVADLDAVLVRTDPPFDTTYLTVTLLLERVRGATLVVNDPRGLREANEKLYAARFRAVTPPTVVSARPGRLLAFAAEHGTVVVKPVDGHGGRGVHLLRPDDPNARAIVDGVTAAGTRPAVAQRFLPGVRAGDKRILLLDGEPLGAVLRVPPEGDFRANIGLGARVEATALGPADRRVVDAVAADLVADGLRFVGLDVVDGWLTEVNVTSPTGLRQLGQLSGGRPEARVVAWLEAAAGGVS